MNDTGSSVISEVHATLFLNGPTKSAAAQTAILDAMASVPETAPTHGSLDDRKRLPFAAETLAAEAGTKIGSPWLWRLTPPKYWGSVDASPQPIARILLHYEDIAQQHVAPVCGGIARLVDKLAPAYAALHFRWAERTAGQVASMNGLFTKALQYSRHGPPGVFAWTWFGPALVERLDAAALQAAGAIATPWGGASLPLVEQPWAAPFAVLRERQVAADTALRAAEIFGDYSTPMPQTGPRWTPLPLHGPSKPKA